MIENKVKVLVVSSNSSMNSGASHSLCKFVSIINSQYKDIEIDVLLPRKGDMEQELILNQIKYYIVPYSNGVWKKDIDENNINYVGKLLRIINNFISNIYINRLVKHYDLIHINALTTDMAVKSAINNKKKLVWHMREFMEEDLGLEFKDKKNAFRIIEKSNVKIAISKSVAEKYSKYLAGKIDIVYNGIDISKYKLDKSVLQDCNCIRIIVPGRITNEKGIMIFCEAMNVCKKNKFEIFEAVIIGSGEANYIKEIKEYISKNGLNIEVKEKTNNLIEEYRKSDIVCVCSKKEAFGRVTVEGMLAGNLVIAANSGGTVEIIEDGRNGVLFEKDNPFSLYQKLRYVVENISKMQEIAKKGQKDASERFSAERNAKEIVNCYFKALKDV